MLEVIRDSEQNIKACCEWYLVDKDGNFDSQGIYVWVNEVEISPKYKNNGILKQFAREIMIKCPQAMFGYFWRRKKYPNRGVRVYHRFQWLQLLKEEL